MGCQGKEIDFKELRTPEQIALMKAIGPYLMAGMQRGATPFPGQLSAGFDPSQNAAMNVMMQHGGQGPYQPPQMPQNPMAPPPMPPVGPYDPFSPGPRKDMSEDEQFSLFRIPGGYTRRGAWEREWDPFEQGNQTGNEDDRRMGPGSGAPYRFRKDPFSPGGKY